MPILKSVYEVIYSVWDLEADRSIFLGEAVSLIGNNVKISNLVSIWMWPFTEILFACLLKFGCSVVVLRKSEALESCIEAKKLKI